MLLQAYKVKNKTDALNIVLVLLCGILAYFFPLEVFILSFAIIGPLHYLTEINWLGSKNYFTKQPKKMWLLLGVLTSLILIVPRWYFEVVDVNDKTLLSQILLQINNYSNGALFLCLALAIGIQFTFRKQLGYVFIALVLLLAYFLNNTESYILLVGILIPTIIHVYLFTLLFMLYGARKSNSYEAYLAVILALLIPVIFVFVPVNTEGYLFNDFLKSAFIDNRLHVTPVMFSKFLGLSDGKTFFFYENMELRLMMFMSFIYLYHYLNWFSKTSTIFWHKSLTWKRTLIITIGWMIMLVLFYINFRTGFLVALFFSFLHVILEFPLNVKSICSLFLEKKGLKNS